MNFQNQIDYLRINNLGDMFSGLNLPKPFIRNTAIGVINMRCALLRPRYTEPLLMREAIGVWSDSRQWNFKHIANMWKASYSPIENVFEDRTEQTYNVSDRKKDGTRGLVGARNIDRGETDRVDTGNDNVITIIGKATQNAQRDLTSDTTDKETSSNEYGKTGNRDWKEGGSDTTNRRLDESGASSESASGNVANTGTVQKSGEGSTDNTGNTVKDVTGESHTTNSASKQGSSNTNGSNTLDQSAYNASTYQPDERRQTQENASSSENSSGREDVSNSGRETVTNNLHEARRDSETTTNNLNEASSSNRQGNTSGNQNESTTFSTNRTHDEDWGESGGDSGTVNGSGQRVDNEVTETTSNDTKTQTEKLSGNENRNVKETIGQSDTEDETTGETNYDKFAQSFIVSRHGNIGVTTSQKMLNEEYELIMRFNPYEMLAELFEDDMMLAVYGGNYYGLF